MRDFSCTALKKVVCSGVQVCSRPGIKKAGAVSNAGLNTHVFLEMSGFYPYPHASSVRKRALPSGLPSHAFQAHFDTTLCHC